MKRICEITAISAYKAEPGLRKLPDYKAARAIEEIIGEAAVPKFPAFFNLALSFVVL